MREGLVLAFLPELKVHSKAGSKVKRQSPCVCSEVRLRNVLFS